MFHYHYAKKGANNNFYDYGAFNTSHCFFIYLFKQLHERKTIGTRGSGQI